MDKRFNWVNDSVQLTGVMTRTLANTIREAEELDLKKDVEYFCVADTLDLIGKALVESGKWSERDWNNLSKRFPCE